MFDDRYSEEGFTEEERETYYNLMFEDWGSFEPWGDVSAEVQQLNEDISVEEG